MKYALILMMLLAAVSLHAAEPAATTVTLQFDGAEIGEVLSSLSSQAGISIIGDSTVKGKVTCNLSKIGLTEALDAVCKMNKLEWVKTYVGTEERPNAARIFKQLDALKELYDAPLIYEDPKTKGQAVFVPPSAETPVDVSGLKSSLKLREIYLVRAEPDLEAIAAAKEKEKAAAEQAGSFARVSPPSDPRAAAKDVWGYFGQMTMDQQFAVLREVGSLIRENLTPEQMQALRDRFGGREGWGGRGRPDGERPPGPPPPQPRQ